MHADIVAGFHKHFTERSNGPRAATPLPSFAPRRPHNAPSPPTKWRPRVPPAPRFPPRHSGTPGGCPLIGEQVPPTRSLFPPIGSCFPPNSCWPAGATLLPSLQRWRRRAAVAAVSRGRPLRRVAPATPPSSAAPRRGP